MKSPSGQRQSFQYLKDHVTPGDRTGALWSTIIQGKGLFLAAPLHSRTPDALASECSDLTDV